jgi:hypothetical protein
VLDIQENHPGNRILWDPIGFIHLGSREQVFVPMIIILTLWVLDYLTEESAGLIGKVVLFQIAYVRTSPVSLFLPLRKEFLSKRAKENVNWFLIGEFFFLVTLANRSIFFPPIDKQLYICEQFIHLKYILFRKWCKVESILYMFSLPHAHLNTNHSIRLLFATVCTTTTYR